MINTTPKYFKSGTTSFPYNSCLIFCTFECDPSAATIKAQFSIKTFVGRWRFFFKVIVAVEFPTFISIFSTSAFHKMFSFGIRSSKISRTTFLGTLRFPFLSFSPPLPSEIPSSSSSSSSRRRGKDDSDDDSDDFDDTNKYSRNSCPKYPKTSPFLASIVQCCLDDTFSRFNAFNTFIFSIAVFVSDIVNP